MGADKAIQIANFLCPGNYAVSGSIEGCEAVERLGKDPAFKARMTVSEHGRHTGPCTLALPRASSAHARALNSVQGMRTGRTRRFTPLLCPAVRRCRCAVLLLRRRRQVRLAVAGAFHTQYMAPAAEKLEEALNNTSLVAPRIPVISNVDVAPHSDPAVIKQILVKQVWVGDATHGGGRCWVWPRGRQQRMRTAVQAEQQCASGSAPSERQRA